MIRKLRVSAGMVFILLVMLIWAFQYSKPVEKPVLEEEMGGDASVIAQALRAGGIGVEWVGIAESREAEKAFGITLDGGEAAVILFRSRYESIGGGAASEYVATITKAFESNENITYAIALATDIVGGVSKKPILAWANRTLAEEIKGKDSIRAFNQLNLKNIEVVELPEAG